MVHVHMRVDGCTHLLYAQPVVGEVICVLHAGYRHRDSLAGNRWLPAETLWVSTILGYSSSAGSSATCLSPRSSTPSLERGYGRSTWLRRDRQCHGHWVSMWFVVVGFAQDFLGVVVSIDARLAMVQVGRR